MACLVPDAQMSAEERACCRAMKNQCGEMQMPASHGCCKKAPQITQANAPETKKAAHHAVAATSVWLSSSEMLSAATTTSGRVDRPSYSPPQSPPSTVSILRI
jgi:hypothetical protein